MTKQFPLAFRVRCRACYGTETWHHARIVRTLTETGVLSPATESDEERLAKLFAAHSEQIACAGCGKTGTLLAERLHA